MSRTIKIRFQFVYQRRLINQVCHCISLLSYTGKYYIYPYPVSPSILLTTVVIFDRKHANHRDCQITYIQREGQTQFGRHEISITYRAHCQVLISFNFQSTKEIQEKKTPLPNDMYKYRNNEHSTSSYQSIKATKTLNLQERDNSTI